MYRAFRAERRRGKDGALQAKAQTKIRPGRRKPDFDDALWASVFLAAFENDVEEPQDEAQTVTSVSIDYMKDENRQKHHTADYGVPNLVIRRGQEFTVKVKLDTYDQGKDRLELHFLKGKRPQGSKGTMVAVKVCSDKVTAEKEALRDGWHGYISDVNGSDITVTLTSSPNAAVGKYKIRTCVRDAIKGNKVKSFMRLDEEDIFILYNAWCTDDQVYMESEVDREEYVLSETGYIWTGSAHWSSGRPWNFGQFSKYCLEAAIYLLDSSDLDDQEQGNATLVCRKLSAKVNSCDNNNGVLTGNWSGDYSGGTRPTEWNGSQAILEQYMKTKSEVQFGQCWVFSGLSTTLCRALGIPCRSVTNFSSAHDTDVSLTIDKHFEGEGDNEGEPLAHLDDSVWNFHVWNEAWFKRPDLPGGEYDGWQAFDATPQESSEGIMQCGPASVKAIKAGELYLGYDAKFIFSEVNGDRISWNVMNNGDMVPIKVDKKSVGCNISSKASVRSEGIANEYISEDSFWRDDLTQHYKFPEGSEEERAAVEKAAKFSGKPKKTKNAYDVGSEDVKFTYDCEKHSNGDVTVHLHIENSSQEERNLKLKISTNAAYYTGILGEEISLEKEDLKLGATEKTEKTWKITAASYLNKIDDDAMLNLHLWVKVTETSQLFILGDQLVIQKPDLVLKVSKTNPKVGEKFEVTITFDNPVDVELTNGVIRLEGAGVLKNKLIPLKGAVPGKGKFEEKVELAAKYGGKRNLIACFNSRQLTNISGMTQLSVQK